MKLIASLHGTVSLKVFGDEVTPERSFLPRDLVQFIGDRYQFSVRPVLPPNMPVEMLPKDLIFKMGKFVTGQEQYPIMQLVEFPHGDAVTAANTDIAELVLSDLVDALETGLGFRYVNTQQRRHFSSGIVVKFEEAIENKIAAFRKIDEILSREIPRGDLPFKPKTLVFGGGDPTQVQAIGDVDALEKTDFTLQRRVGAPYSENRYLSIMALPTSAHIRVLQEIENVL